METQLMKCVTAVMQRYICTVSKQSPSIGTCCTRKHRCDTDRGVSGGSKTRTHTHLHCGFGKLNFMQMSSGTHLAGNNGACVNLQRKGGTQARRRLFSQSKAEHANETLTTALSANTRKTEMTLPLNSVCVCENTNTNCELSGSD